MKKAFPLCTFYLMLLFSTSSFAQESKPIVEAVLPDIISKFPNVRDLAVSTEEDEIFFTVQSYLGEISAIASSKKKGGKWSSAKVVSFSGKYQDMEPFISDDGLRIYFVSNRPAHATKTEAKDFDIWYAEREYKSGMWSEPKNLGEPVNTNEDEFYPTLSTTGNLCFTRDGAGSKGKDDIFYTAFKNGKYEVPVSMNDSINSPGYEFNAFLAPDESCILYTCYNKAGGSGSGDLYISFKKENGEWTTAENMGKEINSAMMDYCPYVNLKSGMLYFTSKRSTVKKQFDVAQNTPELLQEMNKYENGQSRLYQINISKILKEKKVQ